MFNVFASERAYQLIASELELRIAQIWFSNSLQAKWKIVKKHNSQPKTSSHNFTNLI